VKTPGASTPGRFGAGLIAALLGAAAALAASVVPIPLADLAGAADVVVLGTVQSVRVERDAGGTARTRVDVRATEVLKGAADPGMVVLRQLGGVDAGGGSLVGGGATFRPGEDVLLFLRRRNGELRLVGEAQGKFTVAREDGAGGGTATRPATGAGPATERVPLEAIRRLLERR
jgi:hypothetical protein